MRQSYDVLPVVKIRDQLSANYDVETLPLRACVSQDYERAPRHPHNGPLPQPERIQTILVLKDVALYTAVVKESQSPLPLPRMSKGVSSV